MSTSVISADLHSLEPGQRFKLNIRQRRWRVLNFVYILQPSQRVPRNQWGKLLVSFDKCRQLVVAADSVVIIPGEDA